jgi:hypothetical protein
MKYVLLSASPEDMWLFDKMAKVLSKRGIAVVELAANFKTRADAVGIQKAVRRCDIAVVAFGSLLNLQSSGIGFVMGMAAALDKDVLVLAPRRLSRAAIPSDISSWRLGFVDFEDARGAADLIEDQLQASVA